MADTTGPGHGGKNNFDMGAGGGGRWERTEVVKINAYFRKWNPGWLDVGDVLGTNVNQNLINIVNNTNRVGSSWERTLSHHLNAFNGKATGVEVWYYAGDEEMRKVAAQISASIAKDLGIVDRGAKATTSLYVVANTNPHCLLIEWYFVDNPNDRAAWDRNSTKAMINVMKILRMKTPTEGGTPVKPINKARQSVIVGSFAKDSAGHKAAVKILKDKGMKYTEYFRGNNVWIRAVFAFGSTWKDELTKTWTDKKWNHVMVLEGQENVIIDGWKKHL